MLFFPPDLRSFLSFESLLQSVRFLVRFGIVSVVIFGSHSQFFESPQLTLILSHALLV